MIRLALPSLVLACVSACTGAAPRPAAPPPSPRPAGHVSASVPGERLSTALRVGRALEVPAQFLEGRPAYDGLIPSPAGLLEERWVFGETDTVCRTALYDADLPALQSAHPLWNELVAALSGDDRFSASKRARDGLRLELRRERFCIYHECKPPLSPPSVTLEVCDDLVPIDDRAAIVRAMMSHMPALAGHDQALEVAGVGPASVTYRRKGVTPDEVEVVVTATPAAQDALRKLLVERGFAEPSPNLPWAMNSTDSKRSYIFYPSAASTRVSFLGRAS